MKMYVIEFYKLGRICFEQRSYFRAKNKKEAIKRTEEFITNNEKDLVTDEISIINLYEEPKIINKWEREIKKEETND